MQSKCGDVGAHFGEGSCHQEPSAGVAAEAYGRASMWPICINITRVVKSVRHLHASPLHFPDRDFQHGQGSHLLKFASPASAPDASTLD